MFCVRVKEFLSQKNIAFTERDVTQNAEALAELEAIGVMSTPVTVIGDEVIVGFDQQKLAQALKSHGID